MARNVVAVKGVKGASEVVVREVVLEVDLGHEVGVNFEIEVAVDLERFRLQKWKLGVYVAHLESVLGLRRQILLQVQQMEWVKLGY